MTMVLAAGLMSGTSLDGVDVAFIETDGEIVVRRPELSATLPYSDAARQLLGAALAAAPKAPGTHPGGWIEAGDSAVVRAHAGLGDVINLHACSGALAGQSVSLVGYHGQTVLHRPAEGRTWQIGNPQALADVLGLPVIADLRLADMAAGGQGAPLVPVYHRALAADANLALPVAIVNIGGVSNVTWIGPDGEMLAFDCGPGNALIDDLMRRVAGLACDFSGQAARRGQAMTDVVERLMALDYFNAPPPKSLDRNAFASAVARVMPAVEPMPDVASAAGRGDTASSLGDTASGAGDWGEGGDWDGGDARISLASAAATLTRFTVAAIARARVHFPADPKCWAICGGGTRNATMMAWLGAALDATVTTADDLGWSSQFMEAEAFAYLGVRSARGLALTFPGTTGVAHPTGGGKLYEPVSSRAFLSAPVPHRTE